jgi:hypothetical protein
MAPAKKMSDEEHVARVRHLAKSLNEAAANARRDGLEVELIPNGEDTPISPYLSRHY